MPTVRGGGQITRQGYQTRDDIEKTHSTEKARDDLNEAFAGDENEFLGKNAKDSQKHSTHLKSRKTKKSREKTPIR